MSLAKQLLTSVVTMLVAWHSVPSEDEDREKPESKLSHAYMTKARGGRTSLI